MAQSKSRGYCFTINNPTGWDDADIDKVKEATIYGVYGVEVGEEGTRHYQGFIRFEHPVSFARVKGLLPRAHIEQQRGSIQSASEYCKKDGEYYEWGIMPGEKRNAKQQWKWIIEQAELGNMDAIKDEYPGQYLRYHDKLRGLRRRDPIIMDGDLPHEWWYGPTGTGKSRRVWAEYPDHYAKSLNKWWCGYNDEETVVIEEWAPKNDCTASLLKIWADRYPFSAEIKGGNLKKIRPKKIIVTSNYSIDQCFERAEDRDPIKRRFKAEYFPDMSNLFPFE